MIYTFHIYHPIFITHHWVTWLTLFHEQDESCWDWVNDSHFSPKFISSPHTKTPQTRQNNKKNNKKTQSIEWGDRFTASQGQGSSGWMLSWSGLFFLSSFLSLRCPLGSHPSPSIPLFCLFYINTIRLGRGPHWYTFSVGLSFAHMYENTHINGLPTHTCKAGCWQRVVGLSHDHRPAAAQTFWHATISSPPERKRRYTYNLSSKHLNLNCGRESNCT